MNDKELDEILKEVKARNASEEPEEAAAAEAPAAEESVAEEPVAEAAEESATEALAFEPEAEPAESADEGDTEVLSFEAEAADEAPAAEEAAPAEEGAIDILSVADDYSEPEEPLIRSERHNQEDEKKSKKGIIIGVIVALIVIAIGAGIFLYANGYFGKKPEAETTAPQTEATTAAVEIDKNTANPLTGEFNYNKNAIGKRPVAVVVENEYSTEAVRPQWGIADADIVMEGETEFSTRLLFFWADMNQIPAQVGPSRSARPPFIRFSQMWDSIFIHTGLSRSKDNYVGADTVFEVENIDHINLLAQSEDGTYFGRDKSRQTAIEHTGYLNGKNVVKLIENNKISTDLRQERFTQFEFNDKDEPAGESSGTKATFVWSNKCPKKGVFTYDEAKGVYKTTDFDSKYGESNLEVKTLIYLLDETSYIVKENYKHAGQSETYCDYKLAGGEGKILSMGKSVDIRWSKENGKLVIKTADGQDVKLNRGKIYIGYGSSNNGGSITVE